MFKYTSSNRLQWLIVLFKPTQPVNDYFGSVISVHINYTSASFKCHTLHLFALISQKCEAIDVHSNMTHEYHFKVDFPIDISIRGDFQVLIRNSGEPGKLQKGNKKAEIFYAS